MNEMIEKETSAWRHKRNMLGLVLQANLDVDVLMVSGSTGWFGRSTLSLLDPRMIPTLITKSSQSTSIFRFGKLKSLEDASFFPEHVDCFLDFAFQTRDKLSVSPSNQVRGQGNFALVDSSIARLREGRIGRYLCFSSGAALDTKKDPYSQAKLYLEELYGEYRNSGDSLARVWSVSGSHCKKPDVFAFANLVHQARRGNRIAIRSAYLVNRRYCAIEEVMAIITSPLAPPVFDSGGVLVELAELGEAVRKVLNPNAEIVRPELNGATSSYYSDSQAFEGLMDSLGISPMSIEEQILNSLVGFEN